MLTKHSVLDIYGSLAYTFEDTRTMYQSFWKELVNGNTKKMCDICSKLTMKTLEQIQLHCSGVSNVDFGQVNAGWVESSWFLF